MFSKLSYLKSWGTEVEVDWRYCIASVGDILNRTLARSVSESCRSSLAPCFCRGLSMLILSVPPPCPSPSCCGGSVPLALAESGDASLILSLWSPLLLGRLAFVKFFLEFLLAVCDTAPFVSSCWLASVLRAFLGNRFTAGNRENNRNSELCAIA